MLKQTQDAAAAASAASVRQRREAVGLTRIQLANLADCSPESVHRLEAGYVPRRSEVAPRITEALDRAEADRQVSQ